MQQQKPNPPDTIRVEERHGHGQPPAKTNVARRRILRLVALFAALAVTAWLVNHDWNRPQADADLIPVVTAEKAGDVESLRQAAASGNATVAARAIAGLAAVGGTQARSDVERALTDRRPELRHAAAAEFSRVTDRHNVAPLNKALASDGNPMVRAAAARSLGELRSWNGLDRLLASMDDPDPFVRRAASDAVQNILGLRFQFDPHGQEQDRRRVIAQVRAELPRLRPAYEAYMRKLESAQESTP